MGLATLVALVSQNGILIVEFTYRPAAPGAVQAGCSAPGGRYAREYAAEDGDFAIVEQRLVDRYGSGFRDDIRIRETDRHMPCPRGGMHRNDHAAFHDRRLVPTHHGPFAKVQTLVAASSPAVPLEHLPCLQTVQNLPEIGIGAPAAVLPGRLAMDARR